ncbi:hypothetical protein [Paracoccus sp. SSJ]|uniref:hypothetical protein n=1 Tax=Paracoccus sp. SSJ TaxID=3050636 RepID=UPI00254CB841|nr:hypothetical protein [Paracoccus sp. SSJ]MDK8875460.1 hypothetical protein [Paracoccus sp. SSJ]
MTSKTLAEARRCMTLCVPRAGDADADASAGRMVPVSFSLIGFGGERLVFRLVDGQGELLDPVLNPAVAGALRDCIILAECLAGRADPVAAPQDGGAG